MKQCTKCLRTKDETQFYMHKGNRRAICKICSNIEHKEYVANNPDTIHRHDRIRHVKHRERRLQGMRVYHAANKADISKRKSEYGKANVKTLNGKSSLKRERLKKATPKCLSNEDKTRIIAIYESCPDGFHVDHIVPIKGNLISGLHVPWNLQYLIAEDNLRKYNKY